MRVSSKSGVGSSSATGGLKTTSTAASGAASGAAPVSGTAPAAGDALRVSGAAQFLAVARAQLARLPEIRAEKVEKLRAKLASDDYHPDGEAVADGLVKEHKTLRRVP